MSRGDEVRERRSHEVTESKGAQFVPHSWQMMRLFAGARPAREKPQEHWAGRGREEFERRMPPQARASKVNGRTGMMKM